MLHQIEKTQIERFLDSLTERGLSPNSIRVIANLAKQSLEEAVKQRYLFINPFSLVSLPKQEIKTVQALSFKDQKELEHLALQEVSCSSVLLALYTGMRIGEISGLKWQDIDFEREMIQVKRTVTRIVDQQSPTVKTALITTVPKTSQSMRMIPMAQNLKQYLWQKYLETESEHVIVTTKGKRAEPRVINYRFKKMIAHTTFNQIHFHALRHTFATRALEQGVEIVSLSRILGHRSAKMTLDIYGDSLIEGRQKVIQAVDQLLEKTAHDSFKGDEQN